MRKGKIRSFFLGGVKWKVKYKNKRLEDRSNYGESHFGNSEIWMLSRKKT